MTAFYEMFCFTIIIVFFVCLELTSLSSLFALLDLFPTPHLSFAHKHAYPIRQAFFTSFLVIHAVLLPSHHSVHEDTDHIELVPFGLV